MFENVGFKTAPTDFAIDGATMEANQKVERKYLVTAVNVGTSENAEWQIVGAGVEDSSIELSPDKETITDILGITETTVNKLELSQSLDPMTARGGSKLAMKLLDIVSRNAVSEFAQFEVLLIEAFVSGEKAGSSEGTTGPTVYYAEKHKNCTLTPDSIGGSSYVDIPITIDFSNDKVLGTVNKYKKADEASIEFTPAV